MTRLLLFFLFSFASFIVIQAQDPGDRDAAELSATETESLAALKWRCIGPFRGGRSTTVCGVVQDKDTYYFGSVGGGVWKTTNGGERWKNVSDGYFETGSVGAVAVAPSDPNVIYVGMGESPIRGVMTSSGDGVYKSTDAGKTWQHMGLEKTMHISQIRIHPANPDVVYVGAQGSPYGSSQDRGVYRSTNGGLDWEKVHFVSMDAGVSDLSMDMRNPRVLYAAYWDHTRLPWYIRSGGEGSGIWKSADGGDSWQLLTEGLPDSLMGKIGVSVSPANSNRVYAIIESNQGGLYRSDDAGASWRLVNEDRVLRARSWYYMHVFADPVDVNTVHVLNAPYMRSTDGGKTFTRISTPHGDNHSLWIHPDDGNVMINGNDGGANISYDKGRTWSTQRNQPTAQFYRVNADNQFPYKVYGGQQDNSTVAVLSRTDNRGIDWEDFHSVGGCESAFCAFDKDDPKLVYATCIQGIITEYDVELETSKDIMAYTDLMLGKNPKDMKYRFNWNAPVIVSQHNPAVMYHGGQLLLRSEDRGLSWTEISEDLTKNVEEHIDWGGGPITNEGAGGENYHTIMYISESSEDPDELWVGTDDGLVQLTRDGGSSWSNVTPAGLAEGMINSIELSPHNPGTAFIAFNRYKFGDFKPYVYITTDYGATWTQSSTGIEENCHVRVIREDTEVAGLLYAGTERGLFMSWNNGASWRRVQLNLPNAPVTDLLVHQGGLIAATQGRAFWVLDNLDPLRMWEDLDKENISVVAQRNALLWGGPRIDTLHDMGTNPDRGVVTYFYLPSPDTNVTITVENSLGEVIRTYSPDAEHPSDKLKLTAGLNKHVWNMRRANLRSIQGLMTFGGTGGSTVGPGEYTVRVTWGDSENVANEVAVEPDPRSSIPQSAYDEKQALLGTLYNATQEVFDEVKNIRHMKAQIQQFQERDGVEEDSILYHKGMHIVETLDSLEQTIVQSKQQTFQDVVNFPSQVDGQLMHIQSIVDGSYPPITQGQKDRADDVLTNWREKRDFAREFVAKEVAEYNRMIQERAIPFISPVSPDVQQKSSKS